MYLFTSVNQTKIDGLLVKLHCAFFLRVRHNLEATWDKRIVFIPFEDKTDQACAPYQDMEIYGVPNLSREVF